MVAVSAIRQPSETAVSNDSAQLGPATCMFPGPDYPKSNDIFRGDRAMPLLIDHHGILRSAKRARDRHGNRRTCWLPLAAEERITGRRLFLGRSHRLISLQEGVTFTTVMDALAPWREIVSEWIDIDFAAWHQACRHPIDNDRRVSWPAIEIVALATLTATPIFSGTDLSDLLAALASGETRSIGQPTDSYGLDVGWRAYGRTDDGRHCSFLGHAPAAWAHAPIVILPEAEFRDDTLLFLGALSHYQSLLNPTNPLVKPGKWRNGRSRPRGKIMIATSLVETILWGLLSRAFAGRTPKRAADEFDRTTRAIQRQMAVADQMLGALPAEAMTSDNDRPAKLIIAPGAFDHWIDQAETETAITEALVAALEPIERQALIEVDEA